MPGVGNLGEGLLQGYQTGLQLERQREQDGQAKEDRDLRNQGLQLQLDQQRKDADFQGQQRDRALKQQQFDDAVTSTLRKVVPMIDANPAAALMEIESQRNTNPALDSGFKINFTRDDKGNLLQDADGKFMVTALDEGGKPVGPAQAISAQDAVLAFANQAHPEDALKTRQATAAAAAKSKQELDWKREEIGLKGGEDRKTAKLKAEEDRKTELAKKRLGLSDSMSGEEKTYNLYRRIYAKDKYSDEQVLDMVRQSKNKSPEDQVIELAAIIVKDGITSHEDAVRIAKGMVQEAKTPMGTPSRSAAPAAGKPAVRPPLSLFEVK